jgi:hypothetical protein
MRNAKERLRDSGVRAEPTPRELADTAFRRQVRLFIIEKVVLASILILVGAVIARQIEGYKTTLSRTSQLRAVVVDKELGASQSAWHALTDLQDFLNHFIGTPYSEESRARLIEAYMRCEVRVLDASILLPKPIGDELQAYGATTPDELLQRWHADHEQRFSDATYFWVSDKTKSIGAHIRAHAEKLLSTPLE